MSEVTTTDRLDKSTAPGDGGPTQQDGPVVVIERHTAVSPGRTGRVGPFIAGVVSTLAALAIGLGVYLAVSDADDDGSIIVDVPAVDVNIDE